MAEPKVSYTDLTFEDLRSEAVGRIPLHTSRWTDFNESDVGITLLELLAFMGAKLLFYLNQQGNEAFLTRAIERKNIIAHAKLLGYKLDGVVSSTSIVRFSLSSPHSERIEIPINTRVSTAEEEVVPFATVSVATIPPGDTDVQVGVRQGVPHADTFKTTGQENQRFRLSSKAADIESILLVLDGVIWEKVGSFVVSESSDRHYTVEIDGSGNVEVLFGDGFNGIIPPNSPSTNNLSVNYLVSDGAEGNVGIGSIKNILDEVVDVLGTPVSISVENVQAATGGADEETIEHARVQAPAELSALFRGMTRTDFVSLTEGFPGVGKAYAWGEQDEDPPDYRLYNWVLIVLTPEGVTRADLVADPINNGQPSDQLISDLLAFLEERKTITTRVKINRPTYVAVDVEATVYYQRGSLSSAVKAAVEEAVIGFFSLEEVTFGQEIRQSNVVRVMDSISGVGYVELSRLSTDVSVDDVEKTIELKAYEIPFLRSLSIALVKDEGVPKKAGTYPCPPEPPAPPEP